MTKHYIIKPSTPEGIHKEFKAGARNWSNQIITAIQGIKVGPQSQTSAIQRDILRLKVAELLPMVFVTLASDAPKRHIEDLLKGFNAELIEERTDKVKADEPLKLAV